MACWRTISRARAASPRRSASRCSSAPFSPPDAPASPTPPAGAASASGLAKVGDAAINAPAMVRLAQPRLRVRGTAPMGPRRMEHILAAAPDIGWEIDVAWVVRGGDDPLPWIEKRGPPHRRGARQGHRQAGRGSWTRMAGPTSATARSTGRASCQRCAARRRSSTSWSTTTRPTSSASRAGRSQRQGPSEPALGEHRHGTHTRRGHRRLREHLDHLLLAGSAVPGRRDPGLRRPRAGRGRGEGEGVRRARPDRRGADRRGRRRHRGQPHGPGGAPRRVAAGARCRQARLLGEALRARGRGRARPEAARRQQGAAHRLGAGYVPGRCPPARTRSHRSGQARKDHRGHVLRDEPRHGALAPQSRLLLPARRRTDPRSSGPTT